MECERHKVVSTRILKMLKDKTLKLINIKLNKGLQKALTKFILQVSKCGIALDAVVFAKNSLND